VRKLIGDERGVAAVEMGLILAALAPVFIYGGQVLGPALHQYELRLVAETQAAEAVLAQIGACKAGASP
jgi:Flp pilus assembly pilin Flp